MPATPSHRNRAAGAPSALCLYCASRQTMIRTECTGFISLLTSTYEAARRQTHPGSGAGRWQGSV